MENVIIFGVVTFICFIAAIVAAWEKWPKRMVYSFVLTLLFGAVLAFSVINEVGYGHVPKEAEPLAKRLDTGVAYEVLGFVKDGNDKVIFVKPRVEFATTKLYALRVKENEVPPARFALIGGKPVAIAVAVNKAAK